MVPSRIYEGQVAISEEQYFFSPFSYYKIQTNDRKGQVVGEGVGWLRAVGTVASSQRCYGGCKVASSFPRRGWRTRGLSNGTS